MDELAVDGALPSDWEVLKRFLPLGWEKKMRELGLLKFGRKFGGANGADGLLRTMLIHLGENVSLRTACVLAAEAGIASVSDVALLKRLRKSADWFSWATGELLATMPGQFDCPALPAGAYRWRLLDATVVEEPGATGSRWRLHYALDLRTLLADQVLCTDWRTGEKFANFNVQPGDVMIADSVYSTRNGLAYLAEQGAYVLNRFTPLNLPLHDPEGGALDLLPRLQSLRIGEIGEYAAEIHHRGRVIPLRVCAVRRSAEGVARAHRRLRRRAQQDRTKIRPATFELADYILILTTLPSNIDAHAITRIYRYRWQIELLFKRLKSILKLSPLHKKSSDGMRGWLAGKVFVATLINCILSHAESFSPWGYPLPTPPLEPNRSPD